MPLTQAATEKRRQGRPRKRASAELGGEPREQILSAAAALFAERGIGEVSMQEIAEHSGLGQSSLYYWFRRKELIVAELMQQVNRMPLAFARQLESSHLGVDVQLYLLVQFDVLSVCESRLEITEVHRFSRRDQSAFATYWKERRELAVTFDRLIRRGMEIGTFREVNSYMTALTIIAQNESVQNWWSCKSRPKLEGQDDPIAATYCTAEIAEHVATQTVGGLIVAPSRIEGVRKKAAAHRP